MHRITCTKDGSKTTYVCSHGFAALPEQLRADFGASGLALLPQHALLLAQERPLQLTREVPTYAPSGATLLWEPLLGAERPTRIEPEDTPDEDPRPRARQLVVTTVDGSRHEIGDAPLLVGRGPGCDIRLADSRVSQFHCVLVRTGDFVYVFDLASTNGTHLDGLRVQQAALAGRAFLRLGRTRLAVTPCESAGEAIELPSPQMRAVHEAVRRIASSSVPVHIHGESGVGKDVIAHLLHRESARRGRMVVINAAGLGANLAGSELFGHLRGAFTGADADHEGAFFAAHQGTLFLDEIAELSLEVQAELLRAVENGRVRRLGSHHEVPVDVRLITATHRDLAARVRAGLFREDLFHRLAVLPLRVPPLRERLLDIEALAAHFLARESPPRRLSDAALRKLRAHSWPGNVRELINTLRRTCVYCEAEVIEPEHLSLAPTLALCDTTVFDEVVRAKVLAIYDQSGGSVAVTARKLGMRRSLVHELLRDERRAG